MQTIKKLSLAVILLLSLSFCTIHAQSASYQLSTHILDINKGLPAKEVSITLYKLNPANEWVKAASKITDENGRIPDFLPANKDNAGTYKLKFETEPYFQEQGLKSIYPFVEIVFKIEGNSHYHIPITMSANGYSTYRGS